MADKEPKPRLSEGLKHYLKMKTPLVPSQVDGGKLFLDALEAAQGNVNKSLIDIIDRELVTNKDDKKFFAFVYEDPKTRKEVKVVTLNENKETVLASAEHKTVMSNKRRAVALRTLTWIGKIDGLDELLTAERGSSNATKARTRVERSYKQLPSDKQLAFTMLASGMDPLLVDAAIRNSDEPSAEVYPQKDTRLHNLQVVWQDMREKAGRGTQPPGYNNDLNQALRGHTSDSPLGGVLYQARRNEKKLALLALQPSYITDDQVKLAKLQEAHLRQLKPPQLLNRAILLNAVYAARLTDKQNEQRLKDTTLKSLDYLDDPLTDEQRKQLEEDIKKVDEDPRVKMPKPSQELKGLQDQMDKQVKTMLDLIRKIRNDSKTSASLGMPDRSYAHLNPLLQDALGGLGTTIVTETDKALPSMDRAVATLMPLGMPENTKPVAGSGSSLNVRKPWDANDTGRGPAA